MALTAPSSTLTGQTIAASYDQVLFLDAAAGVTEATLKIVSGTTGKTALSISDEHVLIKGVDTNNAAGFEVQQTDGTSILKVAAGTPAATLLGPLTVSVSGTGADVTIHSNTANEGLLYDASEDELGLLLTTKLKFHDIGGGEEIYASANGHLEVNAGTTLDITAPTVDINASTLVQIDGPVSVGVNDAGHDVIFYGNADSSNMTWDTSEDDLVLNDSRLYINQDEDEQSLVIDSEATSNNIVSISGKFGMSITQDIAGGRAAYFTRDIAEAGSHPCVSIIDDNANNTQATLQITQDGEGYAQRINCANTTESNGINITAGNDGNDYPLAVANRAGTTILTLNGNGNLNLAKQPAFCVNPSGTQANISVGGSTTVIFGTERFDQGGDFNNTTGGTPYSFTAPIAGRYQLNAFVAMQSWDIDADYYELKIVTSNRDYVQDFDPLFSSDLAYWGWSMSVLADMDANDIAVVQFLQFAGAAQCDINANSTFSGYLAC